MRVRAKRSTNSRRVLTHSPLRQLLGDRRACMRGIRDGSPGNSRQESGTGARLHAEGRIGAAAKLAAALDEVLVSTVQRFWQNDGVCPHSQQQHVVSNDPAGR